MCECVNVCLSLRVCVILDVYLWMGRWVDTHRAGRGAEGQRGRGQGKRVGMESPVLQILLLPVRLSKERIRTGGWGGVGA